MQQKKIIITAILLIAISLGVSAYFNHNSKESLSELKSCENTVGLLKKDVQNKAQQIIEQPQETPTAEKNDCPEKHANTAIIRYLGKAFPKKSAENWAIEKGYLKYSDEDFSFYYPDFFEIEEIQNPRCEKLFNVGFNMRRYATICIQPLDLYIKNYTNCLSACPKRNPYKTNFSCTSTESQGHLDRVLSQKFIEHTVSLAGNGGSSEMLKVFNNKTISIATGGDTYQGYPEQLRLISISRDHDNPLSSEEELTLINERTAYDAAYRDILHSFGKSE